MASTPGRIRPWRHLAAFAGIVVVLYALVFFTGDKATPKLGIDLQGGTRVTLTARTESGGEPPRDHRHTVLIRFDDEWRQTQSWTFPSKVLERFAPMSSSGGGWGPDGRLYVTGHDHPELYILELPTAGSVLKHIATIAVPIEGQAIDWDESTPGELYGISRKAREILRMRVPKVKN